LLATSVASSFIGFETRGNEMINNPGIQTPGVIGWDGTTARSRRIRDYVDFGFVFETTAALTADAIFAVQFAPASDNDPCVPGAFADALDNAVCAGPDFDPAGPALITIKSGTPAGAICSATVPCRGGAFTRLRHVSGGANVRAVILTQGPKR
jgi:hypothetical protein